MTTETLKARSRAFVAWMNDHGLTHGDVARVLCVNKGQLSKKLRHGNWTDKEAVKLAMLSDLPIEHFLPDANASRILKLVGKMTRTENSDAA